MSDALNAANRLVVKIGSALLVDGESGLRSAWLASIAADIAALMEQGKQIIIVSSGAIAMGSHTLGLSQRPRQLSQAQAAACIGQIHLLNAYQSAFLQHGKTIGQLLLTLEDLDGRRTYLNARDTLGTLLADSVVPIINENDATATEEIRVGDNDRLAARVAQMIDADLLVLLSDIDGLYSANPRKDTSAQHIPIIEAITPDIFSAADGASDTAMSRGGMRTKLEAGRFASACGCQMIVMDGVANHPFQRLKSGERHSLFLSSATSRLDAKRTWLSGQLGSKGAVTIDAGAAKALLTGKSLLAAGITAVTGEISRGDAVAVFAPSGQEIARGLINYDGSEVSLIKGLKSDDIEDKLGYTRSQSVIHRDNLVLLNLMDERQ